MDKTSPQLSVLILAANPAEDFTRLLPALRGMLEQLPEAGDYEILLLPLEGIDEDRLHAVRSLGVTVIPPSAPGYGNALQEGLAAGRGEYILTLESDFIPQAEDMERIWQARAQAEIVIASRYIPGGRAEMPPDRLWLSHLLNTIYRKGLNVPVMDMSSSIRLYQAKTVREPELQGRDYDILPELLVRALANGWRVLEIPIRYNVPSNMGVSRHMLHFGIIYLKTLLRMWRFRNSIDAADYDLRAFDSRIYFQRYWQRRRHRIITGWVPETGRTLDIGCGSSRILVDLENVVGLDIRLNKLRYMRRFQKALVNGTLFSLPFADACFDCVICSEVIEHVPFEQRIFSEFRRVLRAGGVLIVGTPDYDSLRWVLIETIYKNVIPGGYADEHITHYTFNSLKGLVEQHGFQFLEGDSILGAEIILRCRKAG